jgi:hypothetical protein
MFERLTMRRDNEVFVNSEATGWTHNSNWSKPAQEAIDRLAAYEDSGLSPEEVQKLKKSDASKEQCTIDQHGEIHRLRDELKRYKQAEQEGRLVVLPCKVGDTVYHRSGQHTIDDIQLFYPRQNGHVPEERIGKLQIRLGSLNYAGLQTFATYADEIGKTVFLTREEAEKAIGGKEDV